MNNSECVSVQKAQINVANEIKTALEIFTARHNGGITELRILMKNSSPMSGFYDDLDRLAQDAARIDATGGAKGIYITLNPVSSELIARSPNKLHKAKTGDSTNDADIIKRNWLFVDFDAKRLPNTNATDDELKAAEEKAIEVKEWLSSEGFPEALIICSGNGYHLYYQIDLPNDDDSTNLVSKFLKTLKGRFGNDKVDVDVSVSNASRITKLAGTTARKAPATNERPQRQAFIVNRDYLPKDAGIVSAELIQRVAPLEIAKPALSQTIEKLPMSIDTAISTDKIEVGSRHTKLVSMAGSMRRQGLNANGIYAALTVINQNQCCIPLKDTEILSIARSIEKYPPAQFAGTAITRIPSNLTNHIIDAIPVDYLIDAPLTDTGNAECFGIEYGDKYRYNKTNNKWYVWDGVVWQEDKADSINTAILKTIRDRQQAAITLVNDFERKGKILNSLTRCEDVPKRINIRTAAQWLPQFATTIDQYDKDNYLAATQNGTLNLRDNNFYDSRQDDYLTKQLGTYYDETAVCPRWEQFLDEVFNRDAEMIDFVQRLVGYSLTGDISEQKMFILYGFGRNGKSVFIKTVQALLGDYSGTASFKTFDADKQNEQTNDLAMLNGKRFVAMSESAAERRINEPLIKQVTGGDKISCRFLRQEFFDYTPQFKLFLATNHKPIITQSDLGIWRRIVLIPFTQNFEGREDKFLEGKLLQELSGILNWALEGLKKWHEKGLELPQVVTEANQKYRNDSDTVQQWLELRTKPTKSGTIKSSIAFNSYKIYCEDNGYSNVGARTFRSALEEKGYRSVKRSDANYFDGLAL